MTAPGTLDRPLAPISLRALRDVDPYPAYAAIADADLGQGPQQRVRLGEGVGRERG